MASCILGQPLFSVQNRVQTHISLNIFHGWSVVTVAIRLIILFHAILCTVTLSLTVQLVNSWSWFKIPRTCFLSILLWPTNLPNWSHSFALQGWYFNCRQNTYIFYATDIVDNATGKLLNLVQHSSGMLTLYLTLDHKFTKFISLISINT